MMRKGVESVGETVRSPEELSTPATLAGCTECEWGCGKVVHNFWGKSLVIRMAF